MFAFIFSLVTYRFMTILLREWRSFSLWSGLKDLIPNAEDRITLRIPKTWEAFDRSVSETHQRLYNLMSGEVDLPEFELFTKSHVVVSSSESVWNEYARLKEKLKDDIQVVRYALDRDDQDGVVRMGAHIIASKLSQRRLTPDQKRRLQKMASGQYLVTKSTLGELISYSRLPPVIELVKYYIEVLRL